MNRRAIYILLFLSYCAVLCFVRCTTKMPEPEKKMAPVVEVVAPLEWNKPEWDKFVAEKIATMPGEVCVWEGLIPALAFYESTWNPKVTYTENFKDAQGKFVISRGLLQISQESANGWGCGIKKAEDIHDPKTNIQCGMKIMAGLLKDSPNPIFGRTPEGYWIGLARYWSPFRDGKKAAAIQAKIKERCE